MSFAIARARGIKSATAFVCNHNTQAVAMPFWLTFVLFFVLLLALYICFLCFKGCKDRKPT